MLHSCWLKGKNMSWNTIYITGKPGFKEEVFKALSHTDVPVMPGSTGSHQEESLFWVDESLSLRDFKKAIGSKIFFKYRLKFFTCIEDAQSEQEKNHSPKEKSMIRDMNEWQSTQNYLHSA